MKVLAYCHHSYVGLTPAGGAETYLHTCLKYLLAQGWDVSAVVPGQTRAHLVVDGVKVYQERQCSKEIDELVKEVDLVITHLGATFKAKQLGKQFNKPVVQIIHNTNKFTAGFLGTGADYVVFNAQWVKDYHENNVSHLSLVMRDDKKITTNITTQYSWDSMVLRPPVDSNMLYRSEDQTKITLVNLLPNKGVEVFYALAARCPDLEFMGVIGGYKQDEQVLRDLPNVTIHPHTKDMASVYRQTRVVLVPSVYESYGYVGVEAAQYGIPTVVHPTPGLLESLGEASLKADRSDLDAWEMALRATLSDYDARALAAYTRYKELYIQSRYELDQFSQNMIKVVENGPSNNR